MVLFVTDNDILENQVVYLSLLEYNRIFFMVLIASVIVLNINYTRLQLSDPSLAI